MEGLIERIILSWEQSPVHHSLNPGASSSEIAAFEDKVGWAFPPSWRSVYQFSNGMSLAGGDVRFDPLQGADFSVVKMSDILRSKGWNIPPAFWAVACDGGGDPFGLWVSPHVKEPSNEIVAIGAIFEPKCLSIAGSNLARFLLMRTTFYLLLNEAPRKALDTLGVPVELRSNDPDWSDIQAWADPDRPGGSDDPYEARLNAEEVTAIVTESNN